VTGQSIVRLYRRRWAPSLLTPRAEPVNYLPIKIKMPASSATIPITIAPMPT
jgi:hypothetical protein